MAEEKSKSSGAPLPWLLLTGILGVFAVGTPQNQGTAPVTKNEKKESEQAIRLDRDIEEPLEIVRDFHQTRKISHSLNNIDELKRDLHGYKTEYLIATVPDPIDTPYGYAFDQVVDSIQRAVEKKDGYILDRAYLPWEFDRKPKPPTAANPALDTVAEMMKLQAEKRDAENFGASAANEPKPKPREVFNPNAPRRETQPGVLLFRHGRDKNKKVDQAGLCVVFLVSETPMSGIRKKAFYHAMRIITDAGHPETEPIRVIGPYFSGSQTSIQFALGDWYTFGDSFYTIDEKFPKYKFKVITGNATSIRHKDFFGTEANREAFPSWPDKGIDFSSTVIPTRITLNAVLQFLTRRDGMESTQQVRSGLQLIPGKIALLTESNTGFGKAISDMNRDRLLQLRFPLHISRVKNEYTQAFKKKDEQNGLAQSDPLAVSLAEDVQQLNEGVPSQGGVTTTASNGQVLSRILATISREHCRYVGVIASDTRDKLFLIRLIREYCPDVQIFLTEGDLLLTHPEYRYHMRGVILASTYPLVPINQHWVKCETSERILFPTVAAQGYYNATLMQMGNQAQLLEYSAPTFALQNRDKPEEANRRPPVWIGMVAPSGSLVPLHIFTNYDDRDKYVALSDKPQNDQSETAVQHAGIDYPGAMLPIGIGLFVWWLFLINRAWFNPYARLFWKGGLLLQLPDLFYRNIILGSQVLLTIPILCGAWAHLESKNFGSWWSMVVVGAVAFCTIAMIGGMIKPLFRRGVSRLLQGKAIGGDSGVFHPAPLDSKLETLSWIAVNSGAFAIVFGFIALFLIRFGGYGDFARRTLYFMRAFDLSSGLSPLTPLFFLCMAYTAWAFFQLKRTYIADRYHVPSPYPEDGRFQAIREYETLIRDEVAHEAIALKHRLPISGAILAILCFGTAVWLQSLPTVEGWAWDSAFFVGFGGLFLLSSTTLIRLFFLWRNTKKMLESISALPMMRSFGRMPTKLTEIFGKYLFTQKPQLSHMQVPAHQLRLMVEAVEKDPTAPAALRELGPMADKLQNMLSQYLLPGVRRSAANRAEREARELLTTAAQLSIVELARLGQNLSIEEAFGGQTLESKENKESKEGAWIPLAESLAATQVVIFISQFFAQLRNLVWAAMVTSSLLLFAATSYPFHPEKLLLIGLLALSGCGLVAVLYVLVEMNRDEVVSRVTRSTPGKLSLDSGFVGSFFTYIVPTVGVLAAQLSGSFRWALEPILRVMK